MITIQIFLVYNQFYCSEYMTSMRPRTQVGNTSKFKLDIGNNSKYILKDGFYYCKKIKIFNFRICLQLLCRYRLQEICNPLQLLWKWYQSAFNYI